MANKPLILALSVLSLLACSWAQQFPWGGQQCELDNLDALEPTNRIRAEAGVTEVWHQNHPQLQCAGVAVSRCIVERNGLVLPSFENVPKMAYVVQGRGLMGVIFPGCPETFQDSQGRQTQDQHQKIRHFREGDVLAIPAGVAHWFYNHADQPLVIVAVHDINNVHNQLDNTPRKFYLAGNPEQEFEQRGQSPRFGPRGPRGQGQGCNNIFCGFDRQLLAEAFNVNPEVIDRIQNDNDNRNHIIRVQGGLDLAMPPMGRGGRGWEQYGEEEFEQYGRGRGYGGRQGRESERWEQYGGGRGWGHGGAGWDNGLEETFCSMRLRANIGDPSRADIFTPQAGRVSTVNSHNLPVLRFLQLSAERGVLYNNAILAPHSNLNAHSIMYAIRGSARIQVVDHRGNPVFDGELRQGRILVVPQNFAVLKKAQNEGFEWVSFKTNDNAMTNPLAGRTSVIRGIPNDVLRHAFRLPNEEVRRLKMSRSETTMLSPRFRSSSRSLPEMILEGAMTLL